MEQPIPFHFSDEHCRIARVGPVLVSVWTRAPASPQIEAMRALQRKMADDGAQAVGSFTLILPGGHRLSFSDTDRAAVRDLVVRSNAVQAWNAVAIEGRGLVAITARTAVAAILRLVNTQGRTRSFSDRGPAVHWLGEHLTGAGHPSLHTDLARVSDRAAAELAGR